MTAPARITPRPGQTRTQMLTVVQVAQLLGVSKMTIYRLVHAGALPAYQFGRSFRIHPNDLSAYLGEARTDRDIA